MTASSALPVTVHVFVRDERGRPVTQWDGKTFKRSSVTGEDVPDESARISRVVLASGERIDFSPADPGRVQPADPEEPERPGRQPSRGILIQGTAVARLSVPVEIQGPFSSIKRRADGTVYEITDASGLVYPVQRVLKEGDAQWSVLINDRTVQPVSILLSDVRQVWFEKSYPGMTMLGVAGVALGLLYLAITSGLSRH